MYELQIFSFFGHYTVFILSDNNVLPLPTAPPPHAQTVSRVGYNKQVATSTVRKNDPMIHYQTQGTNSYRPIILQLLGYRKNTNHSVPISYCTSPYTFTLWGHFVENKSYCDACLKNIVNFWLSIHIKLISGSAFPCAITFNNAGI